DELAPQAIARLHNAYPNPLSRSASALIKADIPERSTGTLSIFNLRGQMVASHKLGPGSRQISFSGEGLPAGVYLYSLQCGEYRETRKLVLIK
ncbi:MAG TPA: T9SS type A sorting domain-containing protein, partial [Candidatus Cloacimonadota bacterium]|nr:T9SS type A sorting domain-containing protein [Candidatus Cloacimonadota bacterium]